MDDWYRQSAAAARLSNIVAVRNVLEPQRCLAVVRLPCPHKAALCAFHAVQEDASGDKISIVVAAAEGNFYVYSTQGLRTESPQIVLESESLLWTA